MDVNSRNDVDPACAVTLEYLVQLLEGDAGPRLDQKPTRSRPSFARFAENRFRRLREGNWDEAG
jgi:hypothetical protein